MTETGIKITGEELLELPDTGKRYELVKGELRECLRRRHGTEVQQR